MNILKASHHICRYTEDGLNAIDEAARTCYLSEPKDSVELRVEWHKLIEKGYVGLYDQFVQNKFLDKIRNMGHQTPFEFMDIEIEFICDRGVSHEAMRHRMCSPMQESTRYCNYSANGKHGMNIIHPLFFDEDDTSGFNIEDINGNMLYQINAFDIWFRCMEFAEWGYNAMMGIGRSPQEARSVLPNSLKTKLKIKANVREWWHIFNLRALNSGAHPQIREIMIPALKECAEKWPILFQWQLAKLK